MHSDTILGLVNIQSSELATPVDQSERVNCRRFQQLFDEKM